MGLVADTLRPAASQEPVCLRVRCLQIAPNLPLPSSSRSGNYDLNQGNILLLLKRTTNGKAILLVFLRRPFDLHNHHIYIYILGIGMYWPTIKLASCGNRKRNLGHSVIRAAGFEDHAQRIAEVMQTWS